MGRPKKSREIPAPPSRPTTPSPISHMFSLEAQQMDLQVGELLSHHANGEEAVTAPVTANQLGFAFKQCADNGWPSLQAHRETGLANVIAQGFQDGQIDANAMPPVRLATPLQHAQMNHNSMHASFGKLPSAYNSNNLGHQFGANQQQAQDGFENLSSASNSNNLGNQFGANQLQAQHEVDLTHRPTPLQGAQMSSNSIADFGKLSPASNSNNFGHQFGANHPQTQHEVDFTYRFPQPLQDSQKNRNSIASLGKLSPASNSNNAGHSFGANLTQTERKSDLKEIIRDALLEAQKKGLDLNDMPSDLGGLLGVSDNNLRGPTGANTPGVKHDASFSHTLEPAAGQAKLFENVPAGSNGPPSTCDTGPGNSFSAGLPMFDDPILDQYIDFNMSKDVQEDVQPDPGLDSTVFGGSGNIQQNCQPVKDVHPVPVLSSAMVGGLGNVQQQNYQPLGAVESTGFVGYEYGQQKIEPVQRHGAMAYNGYENVQNVQAVDNVNSMASNALLLHDDSAMIFDQRMRQCFIPVAKHSPELQAFLDSPKITKFPSLSFQDRRTEILFDLMANPRILIDPRFQWILHHHLSGEDGNFTSNLINNVPVMPADMGKGFPMNLGDGQASVAIGEVNRVVPGGNAKVPRVWKKVVPPRVIVPTEPVVGKRKRSSASDGKKSTKATKSTKAPKPAKRAKKA